MNVIKFHAVDKEGTKGYAVHKVESKYEIAFVTKFKSQEGTDVFKKEATSYSNGRLHSYPSPFIADHVIRKEILPLYKKAA